MLEGAVVFYISFLFFFAFFLYSIIWDILRELGEYMAEDGAGKKAAGRHARPYNDMVGSEELKVTYGLSEPAGLADLPGGKGCYLPLEVPAVFFKYIIGTKGSTRGSIERDTGCTLRVPRKDQEGKISKEVNLFIKCVVQLILK